MPNDNRIPWWLWPNVLCLDAPAIALAWQELLARSVEVRTPMVPRVVLFLVVWSIYAADRVIDGIRLDVRETSAPRHRFAARHRGALTGGIAGASLTGSALAVALLPREHLLGGGILGSVVAGYFLWNHLAGARWGRAWMKEGVVSVVFAAGCALIPWIMNPSAMLVIHASGFAVACMANCLFIARIERSRDRERGEVSVALRWRDTARPGWKLALLLGAAVATGIGFDGGDSTRFALLTASAMIALTPFMEKIAGRDAACAWADFSLLAPAAALLLV